VRCEVSWTQIDGCFSALRHSGQIRGRWCRWLVEKNDHPLSEVIMIIMTDRNHPASSANACNGILDFCQPETSSSARNGCVARKSSGLGHQLLAQGLNFVKISVENVRTDSTARWSVREIAITSVSQGSGFNPRWGLPRPGFCFCSHLAHQPLQSFPLPPPQPCSIPVGSQPVSREVHGPPFMGGGVVGRVTNFPPL
jgi:hypothetical protein